MKCSKCCSNFMTKARLAKHALADTCTAMTQHPGKSVFMERPQADAPAEAPAKGPS
jgi:hypothetical protein